MLRPALYALAVTRAAQYLQRAKGWSRDPHTLSLRLQSWYLKTRFAYRIPLADIVAALANHPQDGLEYRWHAGDWHLIPKQ